MKQLYCVQSLNSLILDYSNREETCFDELVGIIKNNLDLCELGVSGFVFNNQEGNFLLNLLTEKQKPIFDLRLNDCNLDLAEGSILSFLSNYKSIQSLQLSNNVLKMFTGKSFRKILELKELKVLYFPKFQTSIYNLFKLLINHLYLEIVCFRRNVFQILFKESFLSLRNLKMLKLSEFCFLENEIENILDLFKNNIYLEELTIANPILLQKLADFITECKHQNLKIFYHGNGLIKETDIHKILKTNKVSVLSLANCKITSNENIKVANISDIDSLNSLILSNCNMSRNILRNLTDQMVFLKKLIHLDISKNILDNESFLSLLKVLTKTELRIFYFYNQKLTKEIIFDVIFYLGEIKSLIKVNSLIDVNIDSNYMLTDEFLNDEAFNLFSMEKLKGKYSLIETKPLEFDKNLFGILAYSNIPLLKIKMPEDFMRECEIEDLKYFLSNSREVHHLEIEIINHWQLKEEFDDFFMRQKQLTHLSIGLENYNKFHSSFNFLPCLSNLKWLTVLMLHQCIVDVNSCKYFGDFMEEHRNLRKLTLQNIVGPNVNDLFAFESTKLTQINIKEIKINKMQLSSTASCELGKFISKQKNLESLTIENIIFEDVGENLLNEIIGKCLYLNTFRLEKCIINQRMAETLQKFLEKCRKSLKCLSFKNTKLSAKIGEVIFKQLSESKENWNLEQMNIKKCFLNCEGMSFFLEFLKNCKRLRELTIESENLSKIDEFTNYPVESIEELNFENSLLPNQSSFLSYLLKCTQKNFKNLNVSNCNLNFVFESKHLDEVNSSNDFNGSQCTIDMKKCCLSVDTSKIFAAIITSQGKLTNLNLSQTYLADEIGKSLFENIEETCCTVKILNLSDCYFSKGMSLSLGNFINNQKHLKELILSKNDLSRDIGINIFSNVNENCCTIETLDLSECDFSYEMAAYLGQFIDRQSNLAILQLRHSVLSGKTGENLFKQITKRVNNIKKIDFHDCVFSPSIIGRLRKFLINQENLQDLILSNTKLDTNLTEKFFEKFSLSSLKFLDLSDCLIYPKLAEKLNVFISNQKNLKSINLSNAGLSKEIGVKILNNISNNASNLQILIINQFINEDTLKENYHVNIPRNLETLITDNQLLFDSSVNNSKTVICNLKKLVLNNIQIQDDSFVMEYLLNYCQLCKLDLAHCRLLEKQAEQLGDFFKNKSKIKELNLSNVSIENGRWNLVFQKKEEGSSSLFVLQLDNCEFTADIGNSLWTFIFQQKNLGVLTMNNSIKTDISCNCEFKDFSYCFWLQIINLRNCSFVGKTSEILGELLNNQINLRQIAFSNGDFTDENAYQIFEKTAKKCYSLEFLGLDNCNLTNKVAISLSRFINYQRGLKVLRLCQTDLSEMIGVNLFNNLKKVCCNLKSLSLDTCKISEEMSESMGNFISFQKNLRILNLKKIFLNESIYINLYKNLKDCSHIKLLICDDCRFFKQKMDYFGMFLVVQKNLTILSLENVNLENAFSNNTLSKSIVTLEILNLGGCKLSTKISKVVGTFIREQEKLETLKLEKMNFLGKKGKMFFDNINKKNQNLANILMSHCIFCEESSLYIGKFIGNQRYLKNLQISAADFTERNGTNFFLGVIEKCNFIQLVDFSGCKLSTETTILLIKFIVTRKNLKILNLSDTDLSNLDADEDLDKIRITCFKIKKLILNDCFFLSEMCSFLGKFLAMQDKINELSLSNNDFTCKFSKDFFIKSLEKCKYSNLQTLKLANCRISNEAAPILGKFIGIHNNLTFLDMNNFFFDNNIGKFIFENISKECCNLQFFLHQINIPHEMKQEFEEFKKRQRRKLLDPEKFRKLISIIDNKHKKMLKSNESTKNTNSLREIRILLMLIMGIVKETLKFCEAID